MSLTPINKKQNLNKLFMKLKRINMQMNMIL